MNEQMQKLFQEAIAYADSKVPANDRYNDIYNSIVRGKFAELIVRECDHLIQQQVSLKYKDGWEQSGVSDDWAYGHYAGSVLSRTIIKQHFGVEE